VANNQFVKYYMYL